MKINKKLSHSDGLCIALLVFIITGTIVSNTQKAYEPLNKAFGLETTPYIYYTSDENGTPQVGVHNGTTFALISTVTLPTIGGSSASGFTTDSSNGKGGADLSLDNVYYIVGRDKSFTIGVNHQTPIWRMQGTEVLSSWLLPDNTIQDNDFAWGIIDEDTVAFIEPPSDNINNLRVTIISNGEITKTFTSRISDIVLEGTIGNQVVKAGSYYYVYLGSGHLAKIPDGANGVTNAFTKVTYNVANNLNYRPMAYDPIENKIYITASSESYIDVYNINTGALTRINFANTIDSDVTPSVRGNGSRVYFQYATGGTLVYLRTTDLTIQSTGANLNSQHGATFSGGYSAYPTYAFAMNAIDSPTPIRANLIATNTPSTHNTAFFENVFNIRWAGLESFTTYEDEDDEGSGSGGSLNGRCLNGTALDCVGDRSTINAITGAPAITEVTNDLFSGLGIINSTNTDIQTNGTGVLLMLMTGTFFASAIIASISIANRKFGAGISYTSIPKEFWLLLVVGVISLAWYLGWIQPVIFYLMVIGLAGLLSFGVYRHLKSGG